MEKLLNARNGLERRSKIQDILILFARCQSADDNTERNMSTVVTLEDEYDVMECQKQSSAELGGLKRRADNTETESMMLSEGSEKR
jgi:hypothetical protein